MKKFKKAYLLSLLLLILTLVSCQNKQEAKVETREVTDIIRLYSCLGEPTSL